MGEATKETKLKAAPPKGRPTGKGGLHQHNVMLHLDDETIAGIDRRRGDVPRAAYLRDLAVRDSKRK